MRVRWETKSSSKDVGTFRVSLHSSVSGRVLDVVADQTGHGKGEAYTAVEPRPSYLEVESERLEWSITVEEGEAGTVTAN